jgi:hypothetical protein
MVPSPLSPTPRQPLNGLAIAGFVCGIFGLVTSWVFIGLPFSITGLVLSAIGMRSRRGKEWALAGLVVSILGILLVITIIIIGIILNMHYVLNGAGAYIR